MKDRLSIHVLHTDTANPPHEAVCRLAYKHVIGSVVISIDIGLPGEQPSFRTYGELAHDRLQDVLFKIRIRLTLTEANCQ